jgi:hypothetical protein
MKFPESFIKEPHHLVPDAWQWKAETPNGNSISVCGGGFPGLIRGDGVDTFELFDEIMPPMCYQTKDQINAYLATIN